ncbi:kelch repeat protein [Ostertagia ostertagi]
MGASEYWVDSLVESLSLLWNISAFKEENPKWQIAPSMSKQRGGAGVAVLNGLLYAAGGRCGETYLSCIESNACDQFYMKKFLSKKSRNNMYYA